MGANLNAKKTEFSYGGEFLQPGVIGKKIY